MTAETFLGYFRGIMSFLTDCFTGLIDFLTANSWLFAMVLSPLILALIIFGVNIVFKMVSSKDNGKGGR